MESRLSLFSVVRSRRHCTKKLNSTILCCANSLVSLVMDFSRAFSPWDIDFIPLERNNCLFPIVNFPLLETNFSSSLSLFQVRILITMVDVQKIRRSVSDRTDVAASVS